MSDLQDLNLNVDEESKNTFEALPPGEYPAVVTVADLKDNKSTKGQHIALTLQVIEGDFEGRQLWTNFNIRNENSTAEKIGRAGLASLCKAIGIANPKDTGDLLDKPCIVKVSLDRKDATRNDVKGFKLIDEKPEAPAAPEPPPAASTAPAKPAAGSAKPWQKKK